MFWGFGGVICRIPVRLTLQSLSGTGSADGRMARWILWYGTNCRGYLRGKKPPRDPTLGKGRGGVATNTRRCCDLSAHGEHSAWLAAKKRSKEIPLVGSAGWPYRNSGSSTNCSSRGRCVSDGTASAAANSGSSTNSRSRGSPETCGVCAGGPRALASVRSGPFQRPQCRRIRSITSRCRQLIGILNVVRSGFAGSDSGLGIVCVSGNWYAMFRSVFR